MEGKNLAAYVDHQRWLMNNGLFTGSARNQLFMYGSIVHPKVRAVNLAIDPENKVISYDIYFDRSTMKQLKKYEELSKSTSYWGLWRFRRFLRKHGDMNFSKILRNFVRDYCGPKWSAVVNVEDVKNYVEGSENEQGYLGGEEEHRGAD